MPLDTLPPPLSQEMVEIIPDPAAVRRLIGVRSAELAVLRRLLRVAEARDVVRASASPAILIPTTTQSDTDASR